MPINTIYTDGDNQQLRNVIFNATPKSIEQTKQMAAQFKGKNELETCKNVFDYLKTRINYRADGFHQKIKLPSALLRERVGDCKSYSLFTYGILTNLGIPCKYVLTSYNNDPTPTHIYVVTNSGIIIDAVWGKFNSEKKPTYRYTKDMRISTITGIKSKDNVQIGCADCQTSKRIGMTAEQWYDQNQGLVQTKDKAIHLGAKVPATPMRVLMLKFIENNGGGIATSIWNKIYRAEGVLSKIPQSEIDAIYNKYKAIASNSGVKLPTTEQSGRISMLSSVKVDSPTDTGSALDPTKVIVTTQSGTMSVEEAWNSVLGSGQYYLYNFRYLNPLNAELNALKSKYTTGKVSQDDVSNFREFLKGWYQFGGNPDDIKNAVAKGKDKRPQGKDANYMLMVSKTRGLKVQDLGLIIRGFVSAFTGAEFEWGSNNTYIFGQPNSGQGIGEPVTAATITAWITAISGLLALLSKVFSFVDARKDLSKAEEEMRKLETSGYILEPDYYSLPLPRYKVEDIKQILVPTAEAPSLADIGSAVEFFSSFAPTKTQNRDANTPLTLQQLEAQKKEGALPPFIANEVENAKQDKYTLEALQKASSLATKIVPTSTEKVVTYYKLSKTEKGDTKKAGFGGAILPILIGVGVLMALNKGKKQNG